MDLEADYQLVVDTVDSAADSVEDYHLVVDTVDSAVDSVDFQVPAP